MPYLSSSKTIGDLVPEVVDHLQQRTDVADLAPKYIKRSLQEITIAYAFEELRRPGPTVQLTVGQNDYPINFFVYSQDDYTSLEVLSVYVDYPQNTVRHALDYKTPKAFETISSPATKGIPSWWTRFGANISVAPTPVSTYSVRSKYQIRHPFPSDDSLMGAPIYIPADWEEIVSLSAAMRIAFIRGMSDRRQEIHDMLYGDPEFQMSDGLRGRPGLIAARRLQVERDQRFNSRSVGIVVPRYGAR